MKPSKETLDLIPDDIKKFIIEHNEKLDPNENKETKIPGNEKISFKCLWVFEVYTPNSIHSLINGIDKINWDSIHREENLSETIKKIREGNSFSWLNLGFVSSEKEKLKILESQLPKDVEFASGSIFQYLSSITVLSVQFIFKSKISNLFEEAINKEYLTYTKKTDSGYRFISPFYQKKEAVNKVREDIYDRCFEWFRKYLPGLYSDNSTNVKFPTCEFITLKEGKPFINENKYDDYKNIIGISNKFDSWHCDDLKGIFIKFPDSSESDFTSMKIAGNYKDILSNKDLSSYAGLKNHEIELYLNHFNYSLIVWVFYVLMKTSKCNLSRIRDSMAFVSLENTNQELKRFKPRVSNFIDSLTLRNINKSIYEMQRIRKKFVLLDRNISYFINEIKNINKKSFLYETYKFKRQEPYRLNEDIELFNNILEITVKGTKDTINEYANVRQDIETYSNTILSIMNEKLYKINIIIGIIMVVLTILIIILTFITIIK